MQLTRFTATVALLSVCLMSGGVSAQSLATSLFGTYVDSFREQAGIPALSVAIVQGGATVWSRGYGRRDLDSNAPATPETPYLIGELSQVFGATLLLRKCVDQWYLRLTDRMERWNPAFPEPTTPVSAVLNHISAGGQYALDPARFAGLTPVVEECGVDVPYARLLADELFVRFNMASSVPGPGLLAAPAARLAFTPAMLAQYETVARTAATPYRIDRGRAVRNDSVNRQPLVTAASGVLSSAQDLASFLGALETPGVLLSPELLDLSSRPVSVGGSHQPTGGGWFVQDYTPPGGAPEPLVWQFGMVRDGYSSLILRLPRRSISVVMLANSDRLVAPYALEKGDVTASLFAQLFLRIFGV